MFMSTCVYVHVRVNEYMHTYMYAHMCVWVCMNLQDEYCMTSPTPSTDLNCLKPQAGGCTALFSSVAPSRPHVFLIRAALNLPLHSLGFRQPSCVRPFTTGQSQVFIYQEDSRLPDDISGSAH